MEKIKVGIFFGGPSREREISFAGGRTVYDNLNKSIFEPVPIFVDSHKNFILLDWKYIYKGTIRDFFPPVQFLPESRNSFQIYQESLGQLTSEEVEAMADSVGRKLSVQEIPGLIDIAFLALHGVFGEDGQIQAMLEMINVPYTGSGILPCALGMDKSEQKKFMEAGDFACPTMVIIPKENWNKTTATKWYRNSISRIGPDLVIRPANQGSSIGVSILHDVDEQTFIEKVDKAFFRLQLRRADWLSYSEEERLEKLRHWTDIREGIGFPLDCEGKTFYHPEELLTFLNVESKDREVFELHGHFTESKVIVESFVRGREFSCIVIRNTDGTPVALPPTEIVKQGQLYDYKSKYLPGLSRKVTPINLEKKEIDRIRKECTRLYTYLSFNTYARIDGFFSETGEIFLNDPNTTSGMMPSSFFFHQAAEIGLDPSQFLSYILWASIKERKESSLIKGNLDVLESRLDQALGNIQSSAVQKIKVAVILGGYSFERHISVESGRNIYEKLASSDKYEPIPVFLLGKGGDQYELYQIPIHLLLKDNADDIKDKILHYSRHEVTDSIREECSQLMHKFILSNAVDKPELISIEQLSEQVDEVFIALHGRPGEDGNLQEELTKVGLPFNGSPSFSAALTINKYDTLQTLKKEGFLVADQKIVNRNSYLHDSNSALSEIENEYGYPFIIKPVDDGCSSAVSKIKSRSQLELYLKILFRDDEVISEADRSQYGLSYNEEFPRKTEALIENLISRDGASHFLEITGGLLTHGHSEGGLEYEIFEPSEALSSGEVLSLEEKFLAGEGQNITPARFSSNPVDYDTISAQVKRDLEKAARILGVEGYARIDAFVRIHPSNKAETIIIEVNSLPGMTPATCIFHQCALNGYKPYDFIDVILTYARNQKQILS